MAERRNSPIQPSSFAATAAIFLSAALFSLPTLASSGNPMPCPKSEQANLKVAPNELVTVTVSHDISYTAHDKVTASKQDELISPASLLAPRAEAAIREAFRDSDSTPVTEMVKTAVTQPVAGAKATRDESEDDAEIETPSGMTTRLPGVSDDELSRFKKQMFRRDI